jgi:hypothetical protein
MSGPVDRIAAFVEDLIHNRRPCRFKASPQEMAALRAAAALCSARPGADRPDRQFVENVYGYISVTVGRVLP